MQLQPSFSQWLRGIALLIVSIGISNFTHAAPITIDFTFDDGSNSVSGTIGDFISYNDPYLGPAYYANTLTIDSNTVGLAIDDPIPINQMGYSTEDNVFTFTDMQLSYIEFDVFGGDDVGNLFFFNTQGYVMAGLTSFLTNYTTDVTYNNFNGGTIEFNTSYSEIPEPTVLALLSMGGLVMGAGVMRRRKKD